jgi:small subunit ribosomal protein S21|tara:strand:+ start:2227 stop:2421 length:195 start_codon:yes stop_codon:yes gene_type:complete
LEIAVNGRSNLEMAIRSLRKKAQREGLIKDSRRRQAYEKPSEEKKRRKKENIARRRKARRGELF